MLIHDKAYLSTFYVFQALFMYFIVVVPKSRPTLCDPMDCSMPGSSVLHYLLEFAHIHIHWMDDAILLMMMMVILSSEPFSFCSKYFLALGSFPMSQLFASDGWSIGSSASASDLALNIQGWLPLWLTGLVSLQSKGHSKFFYRTTIWKHQFFSVQSSLWFKSHLYMAIAKKS